jgi:hypothetical protein
MDKFFAEEKIDIETKIAFEDTSKFQKLKKIILINYEEVKSEPLPQPVAQPKVIPTLEPLKDY